MPEYRKTNREVINDGMASIAKIQRDWFSYESTMYVLLDLGTTAGGGRTAGQSDPTAAQAIARARNKENWDEVCASLVEGVGAFARMERLMGDIARVANTEEVAKQLAALRCSGIGMPGYDTWGDPTCTAAKVTKDGLCDRCRQRRDHWRRANGIAA